MKNFKLLLVAFVFSLTLSTNAIESSEKKFKNKKNQSAFKSKIQSPNKFEQLESLGETSAPEVSVTQDDLGLSIDPSVTPEVSAETAPKTSMIESARDFGSKAFDTAKAPFAWVNEKIQNNPRTTAAIVIATVAAVYLAYTKYNSKNDEDEENEDEQN